MRLALDTGVLMLILKGDERVEGVVRDIARGAEACTATTNLAELYYKVREKLGREVAVAWCSRILYSGDVEVVPVGAELALEAGRIKAKYGSLVSLADAIIAALAKARRAVLLTTDSALKGLEEVPSVRVYEVP